MRLAGSRGAVVHKREELKEELDKALPTKPSDHPADRKVWQESPEIIDNVKLGASFR